MRRTCPSIAISLLFISLAFFPVLLSTPRPVQALGSRDLQSGLVGSWNFDEGSGTTLHDSSGKGNDGVIEGGPHWTQGVCGGALKFDGVQDYVKIPDSPSLNLGTGPFSYSVWVRLDAVPSAVNQILSKRTMAGNDYELQTQAGSTLEYIFGDPNKGYSRHFSSKALDQNIFYLATVVRTGGKGYLYINDSLDMTLNSTQDVNSSSPLYFGIDPFMSEYLNGTLDEIRIYDRALSLDEIRVLYNRTTCLCDLAVSADDLTFSDNAPTAGTGIDMKVKVHNLGASDAQNVQVDIYDSATTIGPSQFIPLLKAKEVSPVLIFPSLPQHAGTYKITLKVDKDDKIVESNEDNNMVVKRIEVEDVKFVDLVITKGDLSLPATPVVEGALVDINATITNMGTADASAFLVRFYDGPAQIGTDLTVQALKGGAASAVVTTKWTAASAGTHTITVKADPDNLIKEINEANNNESAQIVVVSISKPDLNITKADITYEWDPVKENETVKISVLVHNIGPVAAENVVVRFLDGSVPIWTDLTIASILGNGGLHLAVIFWKAAPAGEHMINVYVDPDNAIYESVETNNNTSRNITVELNQTNINHPPVFVSVPITVATAGIQYTYNFNAFDQDGDALTYSNGQKPVGMSFDGSSKQLAWTPGLFDKGEHGIVLVASDGRGGEGEQVYILEVVVKEPKCQILVPTADQTVKVSISINGTSTRGGPLVKTVQVRIDGGSWFVANGTMAWTYFLDTKTLSNGKHTAEAKANDGIIDSNLSKVQFIVDNPVPIPPKKYKTYLEGFPWAAVAIISSSAIILLLLDSRKGRRRSA